MLVRLKTALLRRSQAESELDEELNYHIEQQTEQNIRLGMNPEEALFAARKAFGGVEQAKERSRDARGARWLEELWQDLHYGSRVLAKNPGFTGMIVIPCGSFTYCVFEKERALCTKGERPIVNRCHPVECANSFILIEHVPFYQRKLASLEATYANLSEDAKRSPAGLLYADEIRKIHQALEPFTNL